jgi:uncharacterized protein YwgA
MADRKNAPLMWVAAAFQELNNAGSWSGRIHVHKLLFIAETLRQFKVPFRFRLYEYGPYSFELDEAIANMEVVGLLGRSYPKAGYGPRYQPTAMGQKFASSLGKRYRMGLSRVASVLGKRSSQRLELVATCLWAMHRDRLTAEPRIIDRVKALKPRYSAVQIRQALVDAKGVRLRLRAPRSG